MARDGKRWQESDQRFLPISETDGECLHKALNHLDHKEMMIEGNHKHM